MNALEGHDDVYERLADAMDAQPAGFTRTPNKLEIKLLRLVFTPEEALVASTMSRKLETAAEIAERVGLPEDEVTVLLESMIPRRMVRVDTLALETGVKGLGKVEAKPGQEPKAETVKKYRLSSVPRGLVRVLPAGEQADVHGIRPDLRAVRDRGRGREDLLSAARAAGRHPVPRLAQARVAEAGAPQRHRRPLPEARPFPRDRLRLQEGEGRGSRP